MHRECFLCQTNNTEIKDTHGDYRDVNCPVCGDYTITGTAISLVQNNHEILGKARRWLWEQHHFHGVQRPQIDEYRLDTLKNQPNLTVGEMKDRFLQALYFLNQQSVQKHDLFLIDRINIKDTNVHNFVCSALGKSSLSYNFYLIRLVEDFQNKGLVSFDGEANNPSSLHLTLDGLEYAENSLKIRSNSQQIFIAMPFGDETEKDHFNRVYDAIKSSIESNGLTPYRIDNDHHIDRIDSKILSEIQNSRAVIVDLSHSNKTTKPPFGKTCDDLKRAIPNANVYFEAGYAYALGKPVFYICNTDDFENRAFDLATFNCLPYSPTRDELKDLSSALQARLAEVLKLQTIKP
jgi:hypothetical protein